MKKISKLLVLALSAIMIFAMSASVFAAAEGSITIKLPTNPAPTEAVTYNIYKVFDATVNATDTTKVNYTLCTGDTLSDAMKDAGFSVDAAGNVTGPASLNDTAIAAIAAYVTDSDLVKTVTSNVGDTTVTASDLDLGYYYITTSTGSVVTIDTTNKTASVDDKNTLSTVVKSAGTEYDAASQAAIAAVGTKQDFTSQITVGNGTTKLVFSDTMTNMTYVADSLTVKNGSTTLTAGTDYTLTVSDDSATITVTFLKVSELSVGDVITLNYKGLVTSDALSANPATNKATIKTDNYSNTTDEVKVYNAKFTVTKQDGDKNALEGAGFVIKNSEGKYYKLASDGKSISWVDSIDDATEYTSGSDGAVTAFTGLGAGTYTLVEKTVPAGYNKADDSTFTISASDYTAANLEQAKTVINNSGAELPSTGGIGTTIFYIFGSLLVIGAAVAMITRRRMGADK